MISFRFRAFAVLIAAFCLGQTGGATAHPHVMVTARAEILYGNDGRITAIRHHWDFDEAYSVFAVQGLDTNKDGKLSGDELSELAKVNVESLSEFGFFTIGKINGKAQEFSAPVDYALSFENNILSLVFTLPLKTPAPGRIFGLEISDPSWFVAFSLAQGDDAVMLKGAPGGCRMTMTRPKPAETAPQGKLSEDFFSSGAGANVGLQFVNRVLVACP